MRSSRMPGSGIRMWSRAYLVRRRTLFSRPLMDGLAAVAILAVFSCAPRSGGAAPDSVSCSVYGGFVSELLPHQQYFVLMPESTPGVEGQWQDATPMEFERGDGLIESPSTDESEMIALNVSGFSHRLRAHQPTVNIKSCFRSNELTFSDLPYHDTLESLDAQRTSDVSPQEQILYVWQLSPVAVSRDGRQALILGGYYCGGLCAAQAYYLLERRGDAWVTIGRRLLSVS
jgi:hypothetical protein